MKSKTISVLSLLLLLLSPLFAGKKIIIDLSKQRAYALENGNIVLQGRISSGKKGRETPNGTFKILQKKKMHRSNLWPKPNGGAKMPYMMRLTNGGIAMHRGYVPNKAASHGCIRLEKGFAKKMFAWARVGTIVQVDGDAEGYNKVISSGGSSEYQIVEGEISTD